MQNCDNRYKLIRLDSVDSTNNYAKTIGAVSEPIVVVAEMQTAGRGRLGRSFISPAGSGIYMSIVLPFSEGAFPLSLVTPLAAVATCRAVKKICGVSPQIKWVNDIYLNNKKICGILTELQTNIDSPKASNNDPVQADPAPGDTIGKSQIIIGIGVNCFPGSFPPDVARLAGFISDNPDSFDRDALLNEIAINVIDIVLSSDKTAASTRLNDAEPSAAGDLSFLSEYRDLCFILGKQILVTHLASDEKYNATAVDVDRDGALIVERINEFGETETIRLFSAEVSVNLD